MARSDYHKKQKLDRTNPEDSNNNIIRSCSSSKGTRSDDEFSVEYIKFFDAKALLARVYDCQVEKCKRETKDFLNLIPTSLDQEKRFNLFIGKPYVVLLEEALKVEKYSL